MKKATKILTMIFCIMFIITLSTSVLAATAAPNPNAYTGNSSTEVTGITNIGNSLITIISTIGSIASVIVLVVLGIKYMMGSAEEKAEYKKTLLPYIIGAVLVFAASTVAGVVYNFSSGL